MTKATVVLIMISLAGFSVCPSQSDTGAFVHKGLFRTEATFTPGIFLKGGLTATYLSGNLEYYFHRNVSFRGDGYYFLGYLDKEKPFVFNHSVLAGASYHFATKNHWDPYLGFQPGIALSQSNELVTMMDTSHAWVVVERKSYASFQPLVSTILGANYYFQKVFHIFGEIRFTNGKHISGFPARSLSDIKLSFGLGFNFN